MSGFIEQFYYGNIEPQARGISTNKTMAKELGVLNDAEEYLTSMYAMRTEQLFNVNRQCLSCFCKNQSQNH